jgi:TDG/mug DNA glycosylase family protein
MIAGFAPIARPGARVLVLGTVPSRRSLEAGEYYAHPRNAFWTIVERLFARATGLDYAARTSLLLESKVALWDVLRAAERSGSLDASIVARSAVANDFAGFLARHATIRTVFFNGTTARSLWERRVRLTLPAALDLRLVTLPSTSPANTTLTVEGKLAAWRAVRDAVADG